MQEVHDKGITWWMGIKLANHSKLLSDFVVVVVVFVDVVVVVAAVETVVVVTIVVFVSCSNNNCNNPITQIFYQIFLL